MDALKRYRIIQEQAGNPEDIDPATIPPDVAEALLAQARRHKETTGTEPYGLVIRADGDILAVS